jgi:3-dehydroquinate synthase
MTFSLFYNVDNQKNKVIYSKNIENNIIKDIKNIKSDQKVLFVYDKNINKKFINNIKTKLKLTGNILLFKDLEGKKANKNLKNLLKLFNILLDNKFTKNSIIISCGGGVIGDMCGLLSSLYLRGTIYFHIPTTMTAIVDSCIGGKTGINYKGIINSLGNYYHPNVVYISEKLIDQIPNREFFSGFAEIIKCGLIGNKKILQYLINDKTLHIRKNNFNLSKIILETLRTKINFFKNDIREENKRLYLNFGHTFAHAFEMTTEKFIKKDYLRHGEAVGLGLICELMISDIKNENNRNSEIIKLTENLLVKYKLPIKLSVPKKNNKQIHSDIYKGIFLDKKIKDKYPRFISLKKICFPKVKEIQDFGSLNDTIYKIFKN